MRSLQILWLTMLTVGALAFGTLNAPAFAATPTATAPCTTYQAIPHGPSHPATLTCLAHPGAAMRPDGPVDCKAGHLVIYQDATFKGNALCFGPGSYNLTDDSFCLIWPLGCHSANDQLSSFQNNTDRAGIFTTDTNGRGRVLWFAPHAYLANVGADLNDQISYLELR